MCPWTSCGAKPARTIQFPWLLELPARLCKIVRTVLLEVVVWLLPLTPCGANVPPPSDRRSTRETSRLGRSHGCVRSDTICSAGGVTACRVTAQDVTPRWAHGIAPVCSRSCCHLPAVMGPVRRRRVTLPCLACLHRHHSTPSCASTSVSTRRINASNSSREWNRAAW